MKAQLHMVLSCMTRFSFRNYGDQAQRIKLYPAVGHSILQLSLHAAVEVYSMKPDVPDEVLP
jgi:hypothetical protein